ncbi:MAG TPA: gluconate 2-dehydrogenase subunit 3 family protein [Ktedonobacteraceae bacterium]|nr:gluconate 2-dehydrogenase subunit 3 family protein [Ktedonobacteraceae bacterium]
MKVRNKKESNAYVLNKTKQIDKTRLPVDPQTGQPMPPSDHPGYYPGFSTLSQQNFWDEATRRVVLDRVNNVPPIRFFTPDEAELMQAVCDRVLPQDDRDEAHKIPVMNYIDDRLYHRRIDGYQFEDMPPDHEAHRLGLQAIQEIAQQTYGKAFTELDQTQQDTILKSIHDAKPSGAQDIFCQMSVQHFWMLLVQDVVDAYYAHPYAWDEIGFGGPAYPRGYMRLENGQPEPWEVNEQRYEWKAPAGALSDVFEPPDQTHATQTSGQEGSH